MSLPVILVKSILDIATLTVLTTSTPFCSSKISLKRLATSLPSWSMIKSLLRQIRASRIKTMLSSILKPVILTCRSSITKRGRTWTPRILTQEIRSAVTLSSSRKTMQFGREIDSLSTSWIPTLSRLQITNTKMKTASPDALPIKILG